MTAEDPPKQISPPSSEDSPKVLRRYDPRTDKMLTLEEYRETPYAQAVAANCTGPDHDADVEVRKAFGLLETEEEHSKGSKWALKEMTDKGKPWKIMTTTERVQTVVETFGKFCAIWGVLYLFIVALGLMGDAFSILGGRRSGRTFRENELFDNPIAGLSIGILATVLMQSSSTTTSIVISMAAADLVTVENAAFLVMGANIGTSVTNTIVSVAHLNHADEYRRAFTAAVFHDMFNWLTVAMFLPLEASSAFLMRLAGEAVESMGLDDSEKREKVDFLKKITKPATGRVVSVDKKLIEKIAGAKTDAELDKLEKQSIIKKKSGHVLRDSPLSDNSIGVLMLFVSLTMLCVCLLLLVKLLQSTLKGRVAVWTRYLLNLDFKNKYLRMCGGLDNYILLLFGTGATILVQSSSVFTSTLTPLVGIGLIHVEKMTSLTHGANIGTTVTGVLSALSSDNINVGMRVALEHVFFNCLGTVIWFVIWPLRPVPLYMAKKMGDMAFTLRWFPLAYIVFSFLVMPTLLLLLSLPGWEVLVGVMVPVLVVFGLFLVWVYFRREKPNQLPDGILKSDSHCCGKYPNFMQLWGGDASVDRIDLEEENRKAREREAKLQNVVEWSYSPMTWGILIMSFLAAMLALPTAQWRRTYYGVEPFRVGDEIGVGLFETCSDMWEQSHHWMQRPDETCDMGLIRRCARDLSTTCSADPQFATSRDNFKSEGKVYTEAFEECAKRGCRAKAWDTYCRSLEGCQGRAMHEELCNWPIINFDMYWYNDQQGNGVTYEYMFPTAYNGFPVTTALGGDETVATYTWPSQMLAGTVDPKLTPGDVKCTECNRKCSEKQVAGSDGSTICNDAPALGRVTWNPCNGNVVAVTDAGPQQACGNGAFAVPAPKFTPSMVRFQLKEEGQEIVDAAWQPLGFANGLATKASDRTLQDSCSAGSALTPDPKGLDLGDVTMLGEHFVGGDHYGPKLVVWNKDGTILATYVPKGSPYTGEKVHAVLPAIFALRGERAGFASVATNDDADRLYACLKSSMAGTTNDARLAESRVVRCVELNVADVTKPSLVSEKVLLKGDAKVEYDATSVGKANEQKNVEIVGMYWQSKSKVIILERAESVSPKLALMLKSVDFSTGTDLKDVEKFNRTENDAGLKELEGSATDVAKDATKNLGVELVKMGAVPMSWTRVLNLGEMPEAARAKISSSKVAGMFIPNKVTVVLGEDNAYGRGDREYSKLHVVRLGSELDMADRKCDLTMAWHKNEDGKCKDLNEWCPEGDLEKDMHEVAGLAITGATLLGVGVVALVSYTFNMEKPAFRNVLYASAVASLLAWVFLLAAWSHMAKITHNKYGCYFQDESGNGIVLARGELRHLTMASYSWAFCIMSWSFLTISLVTLCYHAWEVFNAPVVSNPEPEQAA